MPNPGPSDEYLESSAATEEGLRALLDALGEAGLGDWLDTVNAQIVFITETAEAVRLGDIDVSVSSVTCLHEAAGFSNEVRKMTATRRAAKDVVSPGKSLMQQVSYVMAGCVYVCEDGDHDWPCGVPNRPPRCILGKRWIQQIR